ncbi:hypothetical protein EG347_13600 [Chryseobacterium sp. G0186]|nr:hypothetical protein EG347_13600 [Chryseobacterium sp. G0186]
MIKNEWKNNAIKFVYLFLFCILEQITIIGLKNLYNNDFHPSIKQKCLFHTHFVIFSIKIHFSGRNKSYLANQL